MGEIITKIASPIKRLTDTLEESAAHGDSVKTLIEDLVKKITAGVSSFASNVPLQKLTRDLPQKLVELIAMITAAINTPSLLLPHVSCGSGGALPDDLTQVASTAAGVGSKLFGQKERTQLWTALVAKFEVVVGPLREALPQLQSLPDLFDNVQTCISDVSSGIKAVSSLGAVQADCRKTLASLMSKL